MKKFKKPIKELFSSLEKFNNIHIIIWISCDTNDCNNLKNGHPLNLDNDHLSDYTVMNPCYLDKFLS